MKEFNVALQHMRRRRHSNIELMQVLRQRQKYIDEGYLSKEKEVALSDNMCLFFQKHTKAMHHFLCIWNCEIVNVNMRTQLSFNYALEKAGIQFGKGLKLV